MPLQQVQFHHGRGDVGFKSDKFLFSLWAVSHYTKVSTEQLIYPVTSLIAEFGGALGLFLGVSFMSIWDNFPLFGLMYKLVSK